MLAFPRPAPGDYAPSFERYLALVPHDDDLVALLTEQGDALAALLADVDEARAAYRYAEGAWSVKQVVGHLTDVERTFFHRAFALARADAAALPGMDHEAYMAAAPFDARALDDLADEFALARLSSVRFLSTLPEPTLLRDGVVNGHRATVSAWAHLLYGHVAHHEALLRTRYGLG